MGAILSQEYGQSETHSSPGVNPKSSKNSPKTADNARKPWKYELIVKDADPPLADSSNWEKHLDQLYSGVFLDHKTKKYWVDKKSNSNCFMLYARALSIIWSDHETYWKWEKMEESGTTIELAKLRSVCWLEVHGKLEMKWISPGTYQVLFIVMLKDSAGGWEFPVTLRLEIPGRKKKEKEENLMEKAREMWIEIAVGEFESSGKDDGEIDISMHGSEGLMWKTGLVIKGVVIKPKN